MKKSIFSILFAVPMMLMTSCSNDNITDPVEPTNPESDKMIPITLLVSNESASRTKLTPNASGALDVKWNDGDMISLIYDKGTSSTGKTTWKVVNLKLTGTTADGKLKFDGAIPETAYDKELTPMYPTLDKIQPTPSHGTVYTHEADGKYDDDTDLETGFSAINKYLNHVLDGKAKVQTQNGDNNTDHLAGLDCLIANNPVKVTENSDKTINWDTNGKEITFEHAFAFLKITMNPKYMMKGVYPIGLGVQGFWGQETDKYGRNFKKEYTLSLKGFKEGMTGDFTLWMMVPGGSILKDQEISFVYYTLSAQEWFTNKIPADWKIETGIQTAKRTQKSGQPAIIQPFNISQWTPSGIKGMFYAWGNLDGYDPRVDNHFFTDNNNGFKEMSMSNIESYFSPIYGSGCFINNKIGGTNSYSWAGLYNSAPQDIHKGTIEGDIHPGQPLGVGDPAAFWSNGLLHVPTAAEFNELIAMQGVNDPARQFTYKYYTMAQGTEFENKNGHTTSFWVAEDESGVAHLNWKNNTDASSSTLKRISAWRIYPCWAKRLTDPYVSLPMLGMTFYAPADRNNPWNYGATRYWSSSTDNNQSGASGKAAIFSNSGLPDVSSGVTAQDSKGAYLVFGIRSIEYFTDSNYSGPK